MTVQKVTAPERAQEGLGQAGLNADGRRGHKRETTIDREKPLEIYRRGWVVQRVRDVIFSALALLTLLPLMLAAALALWLENPAASPISAQECVGRDGKLFKCFQFRTRCVAAHALLEELLEKNEIGGLVFEIRQDSRITALGRLLQKTGIDRLPQLWNVLKGDMSLVGPRPARVREVKKYGAYERQRLYVAPGLTCYWQAAPYRNSLSFEERMALDIRYIRERSFWVDWKIIFMTFYALLMGYGA